MMDRCLQLAALGSGYTAPNPMVGAVLVHEGVIIGEGYHRRFGEAHAEVNCVQSVPEELRGLISASTMYVSLEPCSHFGKTPPCTSMIISNKIPRVVIGCIDPFAAVSGRGVARLRESGVAVTTGVGAAACEALSSRFFTFHRKKRPFVILKWARSQDGIMALPGPRPVKISNAFTDRLVHRWRSEESAILIGSRTAEYDDPALVNRLWTGPSPVRIILDRRGRLPDHLHVFDDRAPTLVFTSGIQRKMGRTEWLSVFPSRNFLEEVMGILFERGILSVIVEGGCSVLQSFLEANLWDEARVITGAVRLGKGLREPDFGAPTAVRTLEVEGDQIHIFENRT